jgi:hypothetical protein
MDPISFYSACALLIVLISQRQALRAAVDRHVVLADLARLLAAGWLAACAVMADAHLPAARVVSDVSLDAMLAWLIYKASDRYDLTYSLMLVWVSLSWLGTLCTP